MKLTEEQMHRVYDVALAVNALEARVQRVEGLVTGEGANPLREGLLALCAQWECVAETPSDPAGVHGDEDRDRTRVLEDEYRWRGDYLRQMWADFARLVCYMSIGPATPEALEWGRKKMDELGLGEGGQAADGGESELAMLRREIAYLRECRDSQARQIANAIACEQGWRERCEALEADAALGRLVRRMPYNRCLINDGQAEEGNGFGFERWVVSQDTDDTGDWRYVAEGKIPEDALSAALGESGEDAK